MKLRSLTFIALLLVGSGLTTESFAQANDADLLEAAAGGEGPETGHGSPTVGAIRRSSVLPRLVAVEEPEVTALAFPIMNRQGAPPS